MLSASEASFCRHVAMDKALEEFSRKNPRLHRTLMERVTARERELRGYAEKHGFRALEDKIVAEARL